MNSLIACGNSQLHLADARDMPAESAERVSSSGSAFGESGVCVKKEPKCACRSMPDMPERSPLGTRRQLVVFFAMAQEQKFINKQDRLQQSLYI